MGNLIGLQGRLLTKTMDYLKSAFTIYQKASKTKQLNLNLISTAPSKKFFLTRSVTMKKNTRSAYYTFIKRLIKHYKSMSHSKLSNV